MIRYILLIALIPCKVMADNDHPWRDEDSRKGYSSTFDPDTEDVGDILYIPEDPRKNDVQLKDKLFDAKISKEITNEYYQRFGRTEPEILDYRNPYLNTNYTEAQSLTFTDKQLADQQRSFGEYVIRRVGEYQFEEASKTNPDLKKVENVKEHVENTHFDISDNVKIRMKYQLSANTATFMVKNPILDISVKYELSAHQEVMSATRELGGNYSFVSNYYILNPTLDMILVRALSANMSVSFTYSPFHTFDYTPANTSAPVYGAKDSRYIAGMNWRF